MRKICSCDEFANVAEKKTVVFVGAGKRAKTLLEQYGWKVAYCVDSSEEKQNTFLDVPSLDKKIKINGWDFLCANVTDSTVLLITPVDFEPLLSRVERLPELAKCDYYIAAYMSALQWDIDRIEASKVPFAITRGGEPKIPKIIHYFWFSGDPYPETVQKCIDSWRKFCPDYELRKWDLTNYKTDNRFANEALSRKCWAFASDFGRCDVVHRYGGIYLDSDVELVKPLDDLLYDDGFFCFESKNGVDPGSGFGAAKGNPVIGEICGKYEMPFIKPDGTLNKANIVNLYTDVLVGKGLEKTSRYQNVAGIAVYPPLVFDPYSCMTGNLSLHEKTYAIHHRCASWFTDRQMSKYRQRIAFFQNGLEQERMALGKSGGLENI